MRGVLGELKADTPTAAALKRRIEGAIMATEVSTGLEEATVSDEPNCDETSPEGHGAA